MDWLNYHHLLYFWVVAREGSVARACEELHLAQPTISGQLQKLERSLGVKLFQRAGRGLELTDDGRVVFRYAEEIFSLGRELADAVKGRPTGRPLQFAVGVSDVLPKLIVYRLLEPAMKLPEKVQLVCHEGKVDHLLAALAVHKLDLVLSDSPAASQASVRAFNHTLGDCGITVFGVPSLCEQYRPGFPRALEGAPFLLPTQNTRIRRALEQWFDTQDLRPRVVAEFEDSSLMKAFGQSGMGLFPGPTAIEEEIRSQCGVAVVGRLAEVREYFYAISAERRIKHPAVAAISQAARAGLFRANLENPM
jgi:LysR family transcriptional activator of nhaA